MRTAKKLHWFKFSHFHNCWSLFLDFTGVCYQQWNNIGVRAIAAEIRTGLARNIIFTTVWCHCSRKKYRYRDCGHVLLNLQPRSATDGWYPSFTDHRGRTMSLCKDIVFFFWGQIVDLINCPVIKCQRLIVAWWNDVWWKVAKPSQSTAFSLFQLVCRFLKRFGIFLQVVWLFFHLDLATLTSRPVQFYKKMIQSELRNCIHISQAEKD